MAPRATGSEAWRRHLAATARADDYPGTGYDLICFFDCLHDMGDPVAAARHAAQAIAPQLKTRANNCNEVGRMVLPVVMQMIPPSRRNDPG